LQKTTKMPNLWCEAEWMCRQINIEPSLLSGHSWSGHLVHL
jgi:hypothetical protein